MGVSSRADKPRYVIQNTQGDYFDIYNKKSNAIKAAIDLATQYPGNLFLVIRKNLQNKHNVVFSCKIEMQSSLDDVKEVYQKMIEVYQNKLDQIKYWRKADGNGS